MAQTEVSIIVPVEVRLTLHDDGGTTLQWIDLDDDTDPVAYDVDEAEPIGSPESGRAIEAAEREIIAAIGSLRTRTILGHG